MAGDKTMNGITVVMLVVGFCHLIIPCPKFELRHLRKSIDNADTSLYDALMSKDSLSNKFADDFLIYLLDNPDDHIAAIVRTLELKTDYVVETEAVGLVVSRELRLISGLAVEGAANSLIVLARSSWVLRVEPDEPVHTLR